MPKGNLEKLRRLQQRDSSGTDEIAARVTATLSAKALRDNYLAIQSQLPGLSVLPMVKANAYGHGAGWAARQLLDLPGLAGFGVATLQEGTELRRELGARARKTRIVVFSGAAPWTEEKGNYCESHDLTPVIATDDDWHRFFREGWHKRIPYELKFNTGMNRLGIGTGLAKQIARSLKDVSGEHHPAGVLSHLAVAEDPDAPTSRRQLEQFKQLRSELAPALPGTHFHLANSSAIWNHKYWQLKELTDLVRPGISLYGVPPWAGAPDRGLQPVMTLETKVLAIQKLKAGDSIGYGATFTVSSKDNPPVVAAILGAGYADGIHRRLNNRGWAWLNDAATRFLGIVSMDLSAVRASARTKVGDTVQILGPNVDIWAQAKAADTIPYELLTAVSSSENRVERVYS